MERHQPRANLEEAMRRRLHRGCTISSWYSAQPLVFVKRRHPSRAEALACHHTTRCRNWKRFNRAVAEKKVEGRKRVIGKRRERGEKETRVPCFFSFLL
jgi:predicted alpha/beta hydrolase